MSNLFLPILECVRDSVLQFSPSLADAFHCMRMIEESGTVIPRTDGTDFYIDPTALCNAFKDDEKHLRYALVHALSHKLLGHLKADTGKDPVAYALALDLLSARFVYRISPQLLPDMMQAPYAELERICASFVDLDRIASTIRAEYKTDSAVAYFANSLSADDHTRWHEYSDSLTVTGTCGNSVETPIALSENMHGKTGSGSRRLDIRLSEGSYTSFAAHLRDYAEFGETARTDADQFQIPLYLYSSESIGAAVIEENEFSEERRLRSLVIAIDTSGSCARELTQRFLETTRDILLKERLFFEHFDLHIMQCDDRLRRDDVIVSEASFRRYIDQLKIYGGAGTDFRPVFDRISELRSRNLLPRLRGILYFTDGLGIYPASPPDYSVTFAFPEDACDTIDVPAWIKRVFF